jgi:hypothetical protein
MQDIGGLRAIVPTIKQVRDLEEACLNFAAPKNDYISEPKPDGYRSVHLIFSQDEMQVEFQIRTMVQHAWATAVETMGTFLGQALKANQGEAKWLEFFKIAGSAFAHIENSPLVPGYENLSKSDTFKLVARAEQELRVLHGVTFALNQLIRPGQGAYHLIILDADKQEVEVRPYELTDFTKANDEYAEAEKRTQNGERIDAVLVAAGDVENLKKAYPNYFVNMTIFSNYVQNIIFEAGFKIPTF